MIIVMQGRLRSTRLPGKGFFTFFGQTVWERMCDIALAVAGVDEVVFATGDVEENELMRPLVEAKGVRFYKGSEDNVLERYVEAISGYRGEYLVRLTCDNYLVQPDVLEKMIEAVRPDGCDYAYIRPLSHYGGEIVKCDALRRCYENGYSNDAKEHVTWDIRESGRFKIKSFAPDFLGLDHAKSETLDTVDDLIKMKLLEKNFPSLAEVRCLEPLKNSHFCAGARN